MPAGLNWDLWVGPAPHRPYAFKAYVPAAWRGWWDFGGGGCADMGCHFLDLAYWALDLGHPSTIEAQGPPVDPDSAPEWLKVRYGYPPRGDMPAVKLAWSVGFKRPQMISTGETPVPHQSTRRMPVPQDLPAWKEGVLFVGDEGMLVADFNRLKLLPAARAGGIPRSIGTPQASIPSSIGHHKEFIEACKTASSTSGGRDAQPPAGGATSCHFDYAGLLTQAVLLVWCPRNRFTCQVIAREPLFACSRCKAPLGTGH